MFLNVLHCIFWRSALRLSHSNIHPVQEWSWLSRKVWFCDGVGVHIIVINDKLVCVLWTNWLVVLTSLTVLASNISKDFNSRRPSFVNIPLWAAVWWTSAHYKSLRSWTLLIPRPQRFFDFQIWFSSESLMQQRQARKDPLRCIERPNSSSASILLWHFLHLHLLAFLWKSIQDKWPMLNRKMIPFIKCEISLC